MAVPTAIEQTKSVNVGCLRKNLYVCITTLGITVILIILLTYHIIINQPPHHKQPFTYTKATLPTTPPPLPPITLLTSAYKGHYSEPRQLELSIVAGRNQRLASISRYHRLFEHGMNFTPSEHVTGRVLSSNETVTYRTLFNETQNFEGVVVLANADIYFDESIFCASLLSNETVLALSRHPSPDCFKSSSRGEQGREPIDFCEGYHPRRHASHDVFIYVPPLPESFLDALGDLKVNQFGAENVVVSLLKSEGLHVVNPCSNIHGFHQHCVRERAISAKAGRGNIGDDRHQFGGTLRSGFVHGRRWMDSSLVMEFGVVDCLGLGLRYAQGLRKR